MSQNKKVTRNGLRNPNQQPAKIIQSATSMIRRYWRSNIRSRSFKTAALIFTLTIPKAISFIVYLTMLTFTALLMPSAAHKNAWVLIAIGSAWFVSILLITALTLYYAKSYRRRIKSLR